MKVLTTLLECLKQDAEIRDVRMGLFWTAVLSKHCGLAWTPPRTGFHDIGVPAHLPDFRGRNALEVAQLALSNNLLEATIGVAAVNSLLDTDEGLWEEINARDLLLEKGAGRKMAIVGYFPFVPELEAVASEFWVFEKDRTKGGIAPEENPRIIPLAEVVGITGTTLPNHTIDGILQLCSPDAYVVLMGPTTPLCPALFAHRFDAICGSKAVDVEGVLSAVSQGATYREMKGMVRTLTMFRDATPSASGSNLQREKMAARLTRTTR